MHSHPFIHCRALLAPMQVGGVGGTLAGLQLHVLPSHDGDSPISQIGAEVKGATTCAHCQAWLTHCSVWLVPVQGCAEATDGRRTKAAKATIKLFMIYLSCVEHANRTLTIAICQA